MSLYVENSAITAGPQLQRKHVDGPLLTWAGHMHWLTWRERFAIYMNTTTMDAVAARRWPHLAKLRADLQLSKKLAG